MEMSQPEEIELHEAVLEYMSNSTDKSLITMKAIKIALEKQFGCVLDSHQSVLKKSIHAFVENLVGKDENVEIAELRNTQFKRKRGGPFDITSYLSVVVFRFVHVEESVTKIPHLLLTKVWTRSDFQCTYHQS
jgi:translation initiation factor 2 alpha subunit (eIF-2alpha)